MTALRTSLTRALRISDPTPDAVLLGAAAAGEPDSFPALVARHGPMVLRVCQQVLGDAHAAEDAFQAVFLVLARQAGRLRRPERLAAWLFGTARHIAQRALRSAARRRRHEGNATPPLTRDPLADLTARELFQALDEEVERLPETYRLPLLLRYWQGLTQDQAARRLGWAAGSVKGRLERGRKQLANRLTKRGLAPSALLVMSFTATVRGELLARTAALATSGAVVPAGVLALVATAGTAKLLPAMVAALLVVGAGAIGLAGGWAEPQKPAAKANESPPVAQAPGSPKAEPRVDRFGDPLPEGALARIGTVRFRHAGTIGQLAFLPDSQVLAAADSSGNLCLWNPQSGQLQKRISFGGLMGAVAFSPDGRWLIAADSNELCRWDAITGERLPSFPVKDLRIEKLTFSPDGNWLACRGRTPLGNLNVIAILDPANGNELYRFDGLRNYASPSFAFSLDSANWACADKKDREVKLYESRTGKLIRQFAGHQRPAATVAFAPDGKTIASTESSTGTLRFWETGTGKLLSGAGNLYAGENLAYSPDGRLLVGSGGLRPAVWDVAASKSLSNYFEKQRDGGDESVLSPDGKWLATYYQHTIYLWDVTTGKAVRPREGHEREVYAVSFAPDGKSLVSVAGEMGTVRRWNVLTGEELPNLGKITDLAYAAAHSPDGKFLAVGTGNHDGTIWLLNADTGQEIRRMTIPGGYVTSLALSADGKTLASRAHARAIHIWDVGTGRLLNQFPGSPDGHMNVALSPDGKTVADAGAAGICLWDVASGKERDRFPTGDRQILSLAFSPDGRLLASGGETIRLWNVTAGKQLRQFSGHDGWVRCVAFSPDNRMIVSSGADSSVRLWEVATGRERRRSDGHHGAAKCASFSRDGKLLATGGVDTTVLIWDLAGSRDKRLTEADLAESSAALADTDARKAFAAINALVASPEQCVSLLSEHVRPIPSADARTQNLIRDLDSEKFAVREQANRVLEKMGNGAEGALQAALAQSKSAEVRQAVQRLLDRLDEPTPEVLRTIRAVEVLEHFATPAARDLLAELAKGAPGARLTVEAKASLERLKAR
jgi:RNA polymerase sigma factor (sigma-70 family)